MFEQFGVLHFLITEKLSPFQDGCISKKDHIFMKGSVLACGLRQHFEIVSSELCWERKQEKYNGLNAQLSLFSYFLLSMAQLF